MKFLSTFLTSMVALSAFFGCQNADDDLPKTVKATGTITIDGAPVVGASIVAMDEKGGSTFARAISDSSGRFSLDAFEAKKGAVPGEYKVTVSKTIEVSGQGKIPKGMQEEVDQAAASGANTNVSWKNELPDKYNNPAQSGLKITVPQEGTSALKLELTQ